jgi:hypothetical protein
MVVEEDVTLSPALASEDVPWGERRPVKKPVVLFAGRVLEAGPVEETSPRLTGSTLERRASDPHT